MSSRVDEKKYNSYGTTNSTINNSFANITNNENQPIVSKTNDSDAVIIVENASDSFYLNYIYKKTIITLCVIIAVLITAIIGSRIHYKKVIKAIESEAVIEQVEESN